MTDYHKTPLGKLPHKHIFFPLKGTYLNAGVQHPVSRGAVESAKKYMEYKGFHLNCDLDPIKMRKDVISLFAQLINADADELTYVQSTTVGENLIINALDIKSGDHIVTDDLHYFGSFQLYGELKAAGVKVTTIRSINGDIDYDDYEKAITSNTKLVSLSSVSTFNGHQHDLDRVCEIAHKNGAYVYADIIHHVGATPLDVKSSGVDFCSCGAFKWLMADQGLGFLYVKSETLPKLKRPWFGKRQVKSLTTHVFPGDEITDDENVYEYELNNTTEGYFSIWSEPRIVVAQLEYSLEYILEVGVDQITQYRAPMLKRLQEEIPKLGFKALTPKSSITPLLAFECENAQERLKSLFEENEIYASLYKGHFRIALSVYTDMDDVERFIEVLKLVN
ncbi:MAG: aminotransferase class V-fold PLP-dependent enzyme [Emcibacteraceae bacterium]|nr:aminotransferase class V-fold PLP-dependent enzyme [Emcibacteraceae bacterium]